MVKLVKAFQSIVPIKTLIVGDFMLDTYTTGSVERISPEAPVPILKVRDHTSKAGGAGNVVLNMLALGSTVFAMGRIGKDPEGKTLLSLLQESHAHTEYLFLEENYFTPLKHRFIADNQQLIRVDRETLEPLSKTLEEEILSKLPSIVQEVDVIAISDYGKGFLSNRLLSALIQEGKKAHVPIIVDPKGTDFSKYQGATLIKPNLKEAYGASKLSSSHPLKEVADLLLKISDAQYLVITRSSDGISLFQKDREEIHFPVRSVKEVKDVTGAGDTVLATLTLALGNQVPISDGLELANLAAGIAVERFGCAHVSFSDLANRLLEVDFQNKIYDESHLFVLKESLKGKDFSLVVLEKEDGISSSLFRHLQTLSRGDLLHNNESSKDRSEKESLSMKLLSEKSHFGKVPSEDFSQKNKQILICTIKDPHPDEDYLSLLSSLQEVDFIILQKKKITHLFSELSPQEVYEIKGKKLIRWKNPRELLESLMENSLAKK